MVAMQTTLLQIRNKMVRCQLSRRVKMMDKFRSSRRVVARDKCRSSRPLVQMDKFPLSHQGNSLIAQMRWHPHIEPRGAATANTGFRWMPTRAGLAITWMLVVWPASYAYAKPNPSGISDAEAKRFLSVVQSHIAKDNARALSQVIEFPLSVNVGKSRRKLSTAGEFTGGYAKIVTPAVREKILAQQPAKLFHRADGVMIGDGEVWFRAICEDDVCTTRRTRIVTFNVPVEEAATK
jgi:hypothetical protein